MGIPKNRSNRRVFNKLSSKSDEKLSHKKQTVHLNDLYAVAAEEINKIQNSNYWHWGNNWDSLEIRLKLLLGFLQANNIPPLPVTDLTKIILDNKNESTTSLFGCPNIIYR